MTELLGLSISILVVGTMCSLALLKIRDVLIDIRDEIQKNGNHSK